MFGLFKKQNTVEGFWKWFEKNEQELRSFPQNPDYHLNRILKQLQKIEKNLAVELEPARKGSPPIMTISADGVRENFPIVQEFISNAPVLEHWKFVAFRQRMSKDQIKGMVLRSQDFELNPMEMRFAPISDRDNLDIILYTKGVNAVNYEQVAYGGLLLVDNILGEYDCVTKVRSYDFHQLPTSKSELRKLKPLLQLADFVDRWTEQKAKN